MVLVWAIGSKQWVTVANLKSVVNRLFWWSCLWPREHPVHAVEENKLHSWIWRMGYGMSMDKHIAFCPWHSSCLSQRELHRMNKGKALPFAVEGNGLFIIPSLFWYLIQWNSVGVISLPSHLPFSLSALLPSWHLSFLHPSPSSNSKPSLNCILAPFLFLSIC